MSQIILPGHIQEFPFINRRDNGSLGSVTLNATGETCCMIGHVMLENPLGGSKTISSAGGGSIVWRSGSIIFSNAGTTFEVGIQDVSTASAPGQGDGTFDVKASFTGGGGGVTANATQTSAMTSGTKTIAHGDLIAITFAMTAAGGSDSVNVQCNSSALLLSATALMPAVTSNTTGSFTRVTTSLPNAYILFDDGSIGWIYGTSFCTSLGNAQSVNSGTATADEYGNLINVPCTFTAVGISALTSFSSASTDLELILYSDPLGTPVAERTVTIDGTQVSGTSLGARLHALFSSPFPLKANTSYAVAIRPTTTNNVTIYYSDGHDSTSGKTGYPNSNCYAVRRLDNTGAFSDYNGGTAKTRLMYITMIGAHMEQGVNSGNYRIGI